MAAVLERQNVHSPSPAHHALLMDLIAPTINETLHWPGTHSVHQFHVKTATPTLTMDQSSLSQMSARATADIQHSHYALPYRGLR
ncbi:hypothetical protein MN608_08089 [Microdochium nivale]|nr:hypothetical protein MN608_08089 [Microdochium nivale]